MAGATPQCRRCSRLMSTGREKTASATFPATVPDPVPATAQAQRFFLPRARLSSLLRGHPSVYHKQNHKISKPKARVPSRRERQTPSYISQHKNTPHPEENSRTVHESGHNSRVGSGRVGWDHLNNTIRPESTRPVIFRTPPDPTRPDPLVWVGLLTRPAGGVVMIREQP